MVYFLIILAVIVLMLFFKAFRETQTGRKKHDYCCDQCSIRSLCEQYRAKKNMDSFKEKAN